MENNEELPEEIATISKITIELIAWVRNPSVAGQSKINLMMDSYREKYWENEIQKGHPENEPQE